MVAQSRISCAVIGLHNSTIIGNKMHNISASEVDQITGSGAVALVALALAIIVNADKLSEFANGVFDGFGH